MREARFLIGIDLGTSNCAVAAAEPAQGLDATVTDIPIMQLQRPGEVAPRPLLPSCIYLPGEHELPPEAIRLPWDPASGSVVGELARWQGTRVPGRLAVSAKSWLCHPGVDRSAPILPWGAAPDVNRISPVEASARLLTHMVRSWDFSHPDAPLAEQEVIITVPASFDEVARSLTVTAVRRAGLQRFTLVEEPQAAFYDFTARHRRDLGGALDGTRLVLVVDVGGGTTDFTLVRVDRSARGPALTRLAVGDHLLLGGDNMDAALGRRAEERMLSGGRKLGPAQWSQLVQASRLAKETLLSEDGPERYHLSVVGEGSRLVGSSLSAQVSRAEVKQVILDGFFPRCEPDEAPRRGPRVALLELGLPYAQDPAITRQLAAFLQAHAAAGLAALGQAGESSRSSRALPRPDAILLNGGVFNSRFLAARLVDVVSSWWPEAPPIRVLQHDSLELAVARGAAFYGLVRRGQGRRIGGGAARALYVGLEKKGVEEPMALCVIPRGHEEGKTVDLGGRTFHLTLGRPVQFPLFTTTSDRREAAGAIVPVGEDLHPLPPIHTLLESAGAKAGRIPVHLQATLTEIGTLELWCVSNKSGERWRLEFELRGAAASGAVVESLPAGFAEARAAIEQVFGHSPGSLREGGPAKGVKHLWKSLEQALGPREQWRVPLLRELWGLLFPRVARRRRSADHERLYYQLVGYTLRPGFGYPLDAWRAAQIAPIFGEGVQFHKEKPVWIEFWVMWRRIAGGLAEERQLEIWTYLKPRLAQRLSPAGPKQVGRPKGIQPEGLDEMVRLAAALEHLPLEEKVELGDWIAARLSTQATAGGPPARGGLRPGGPWAWALGRLGARVPLYGSVHKVVGPEKAAGWLASLLDAQARNVEGALFAVVQLARLCGDRSRDLDEALRSRALTVLQSVDAPPSWQRLLTEVVAMETSDEARALGDTLPVGLQIA